MDKQPDLDQRTLKRKPKRRHPILRALAVIALVAFFSLVDMPLDFILKPKKQLQKRMIQLVLRQSAQISMAKNRSVFFY